MSIKNPKNPNNPENLFKNAAYGQQSTLSPLYEIQSKTVNRVKNGQKQCKTVKIGQNSFTSLIHNFGQFC